MSIAALPLSQTFSLPRARQRGVATRVVGLGCLLALGNLHVSGVAQIWMTGVYNLALLVGLLLVGWQMGTLLLRRAAPEVLSWPGQSVMAIVLGWGILSTALFVLGLLGLYYAPLLAVLLGGATFITIPPDARPLRDLWRSLRSWIMDLRGVEGFVTLCCIILMAGTMAALAVGIPLPLHDSDAISYHQVGVRLYLEHHAMIPLPHIADADGPINTELLFLLGAAFGSDTFGQALVWGQGALIAVLVVLLGRGYWPESRVAGWLAGAVYLAVPLDFLFAIPYNDVGLSLGEFSALAGLVAFGRRPTRRGAMVCGLLIGFALGQKMSALPFLAALIPAGVILIVNNPFGRLADREREQRHRAWEMMLRRGALLGLAVLVGLVIAMPCYLRNVLWFHNPFMPLSVGAAQQQIPDTDTTVSILTTTHPAAYSSLVDQLLAAGVAWFQLFWSYVSPLLILAVPGFFLAPRRIALAFGVASSIGYLIWLRYTPWELPPRYMLCWIAPMALATTAALLWPSHVLRRRSLVLPAFVVVLGFSIFNILFQVLIISNRDSAWAYVTGKISRDHYLSMALPAYPAMQFLNGVDANEQVQLIGEQHTYYIHAPSLPDWGGQALAAFEAQGSPRQVARALWGEGTRYVLAADALLPPNGSGTSWTGTWREGYLIPLYHRAGFSVYRMRPHPLPPSPTGIPASQAPQSAKRGRRGTVVHVASPQSAQDGQRGTVVHVAASCSPRPATPTPHLVQGDPVRSCSEPMVTRRGSPSPGRRPKGLRSRVFNKSDWAVAMERHHDFT